MAMLSESELQVRFKEHLFAYRFAEAYQLLEYEVKKNQLVRFLHQVTEEHTGLLSYTFINFVLAQESSAFWHRAAAYLAAESLVGYKLGNHVGLYHILQAIALDPEDWLLKEYALSFYDKGLLANPLAQELAEEVLRHEPFNRLALRIVGKPI
ncbi:MAG: hypothetical protein HC913_11685 [Microscillaceae bacterium]|nr:hypothetical protein [Microscillaceae bacterium]